MPPGPRRMAARGASVIDEDNWCSAATFGEGYNPSALVEALTGRLVEAARGERAAASAGTRVPFNAKPFIAAFEHARTQLSSLRSEVEAGTAELASSANVANNQYSARLSDLGRNFDAVGASFSALEERISDVSRVSVRVGEQLASLDKQRRRATEAHALIRYYYQFAQGDSSQLDLLRKDGGKEGRLRTAVIARRLQAISREIDVPGAEKTRDAIDAYCERFERDMLRIFDKYYRRSDPRMMAHIARVLQNFNGGHSAINLYVNQHDFFINTEHIMDMKRVAASPIWATIYDPSAPAPKTDPSLDELFEEIRKTVDMEAQIIAAVFPSPGVVMQTFLQRVFAQCIQGHLELLLERAGTPGTEGEPNGVSHSDLAVLRALQLARDQVLELVKSLKQYDFKTESLPESSGLDMSMGENGANVGAATARSATLAAMLDSSAEELFVSYLEGSAYLDRERKSLNSLYSSALSKFAEAHRVLARDKLAATGLLGRVRGATGMPATLGVSAGKNVGNAFSKLQGLMTMRTASASPAPGDVAPSPISEDASSSMIGGTNTEDGTSTSSVDESLLNLEQAARMLQWHAEAIGRCVDLSPAAEVPKNVFALVQVLAEYFDKQWLEISLESAIQAVSVIATGSTSDLLGHVAIDTFVSALEVLHQVELISSLWQHYIATAVLPLVTASMTVRRQVAVFNHHNQLRIEGKCEQLTQKLVDSIIIALLARLVNLQKKTDFNPKNDDVVFSKSNTDACASCVELLERLQEAFKLCLSPANHDAVATEVGTVFHAQLLEHLKKYTVSASGGLVLGKDLAKYQDAVAGFGVPALGERFEMLRQLGNLFIVQPASLAQYMQESHLATIDQRLLRPYLMKRTDYAAVKDLAIAPMAARLSAVAAPSGTSFAEPDSAATKHTTFSSLADTIRRLEEEARVQPATV